MMLRPQQTHVMPCDLLFSQACILCAQPFLLRRYLKAAVALQEVLNTLKVSLGTTDTKFSAALGQDKRISVVGSVKGSQSYLTRVGTFDVDLSLQGIILLVRHTPRAVIVWLLACIGQRAGALPLYIGPHRGSAMCCFVRAL